MKVEDPYELKSLAARIVSGDATEQEKAIAESWLIFSLMENTRLPDEAQLNASDSRMHKNMQRYLDKKATKTIPLWKPLAAAVIVLIMLSLGLVFHFSKEKRPETRYVQDVLPGVQGATLTLSNGRKINLSDIKSGPLASQSGVRISKSASGAIVYQLENQTAGDEGMNTLSTKKGETIELLLPDGSHAWLNAASSLTYSPKLMENGQRIVNLTGEGFFEVTKDASHPFIVKSGSQQVRVLGTRFNVNNYPEEAAIATTLVEGLVNIHQGGESSIINPGQQAINQGGKIIVSRVNTETYTDWKDGDFNLDNLDFKQAMRKLARWYDVKVVYQQPLDEGLKAWGMVSRNQKLSAVLAAMERSGIARFSIRENTVYVSKP